ncbi:hypothetical protein [Pedobacter sp. BMA]|nr:hypothetical protein [Pedobacter sp. BMA]
MKTAFAPEKPIRRSITTTGCLHPEVPDGQASRRFTQVYSAPYLRNHSN